MHCYLSHSAHSLSDAKGVSQQHFLSRELGRMGMYWSEVHMQSSVCFVVLCLVDFWFCFCLETGSQGLAM